MRTKQLFLILALICAVVQGAKAQTFDVWDGVSETEPGFVRARTSYGIVLQINTAAELAWVMRHPGKSIIYYNEWAGSDCITSANSDCIDINGNFDMTAANWAPISYRNGPNRKIIFNGKGHTIKIKIDSDTDENGQGLFKEIASNCSVVNLHLDCYIKVDNARMVGGIVGDNHGTVENCYVTGHVESNHYSSLDADLGGIAGLNESDGKIKYCCVTADVKNTDKNYGVGGIAGSNDGTIEHVTFYGTVSVDHSQDNTWVGDQDKTLNNNYTSFNQSEYNDSSGKDMYRSAIKYPYAINITTAGPGSIKFSVEGEENAPGARPDQTVTVTKTSGNAVVSFSVKNDDGNDVSVSGNEASGWTFSMPKSKVEIKAVFLNDDGSLPIASTTRQLDDGKTYKVTENVTLNGRLWVIGTVKLILGEGATLNARRGIEVRSGYKSNLTIDGPGTLNINECYDGDAGIGSTEVGTLTINGGTINVKGGRMAAAIGGSQNNTTGGTITINGGIINATGGDEAAGIGGGYNSFGWFDEYGVCGDITINGGQVTAKGGRAYLMSGDYAAGIGPGNSHMGMGSQKSGTLTLSWTNMSDFVYIDKLKNGRGATLKSITFADGKQFVQEGTSTFATADNIEGKKIVPYFTLSGTGTEGDPYTIGSADDWNAFANYVNNGGMSFEGQFVKLTNNISVSTMVGTSYANSFQGTFDGGGHTLTVNYNSSENNAAPFSHVSNATIKNLRVAGTITTSAPFAGGIVSESHGALTLTGCISSVAINSTKSGDGTHGGLVSTLSGKDNAIIIEGCVFDGSFASTTGTVGCGGFIGWGVYNKPTIKNSLLKPGSVDANMLGSNFARWHTGDEGIYEPTITNCYFVATANLPTDQGTQAYTVANAPANLGNLVQNYGMVAVYQNGIQFDGKYYVRFPLRGTGTSDDPYLITNATDWDYFASFVSSGYSFNNQYVKLNADISVSTMAGVDYAFSFQGTFDGDGNTLTVNYNTTENNAAPFSHVRNATIKNLRVAGSITTSAPFAGGIVSESHEALTLTGCISSVAINSSKSGDGTHAGLVSVLSGQGNAILIDGCVFDGSFATTTGTIGCGGFIGWGVYNKPTIKNSLLKPGSVDANMLGSNFARWHTGDEGIYEPTITNCYFVATANLPTDQGTQAYAVTNVPANLGNLVQNYGMVKAYENGILFDGKYYVAPATISLADNADNNDAISNAEGSVADVTLADRTLYKDGKWNTICLPFDVVLEGSALAGATARPLTAASISGTTLNLTFGDAVTELVAGTPYIIKWASGNNIVSPVFYGVTIDKTDRSYDNGQSGDIRVRFLGTYKSTAFDSENKSILLMGGENMLFYPTNGAGIGAQRAYFKIGSDAALARRLTSFNIDFGGDDETTGIIELKNSRIEELNSVDAWFSLDGRKLDGKPTRAGLYINNGNIVVIKH